MNAHIEQVTAASWRLTSDHFSVVLSRIEYADFSIRWCVRDGYDGRELSRWTRADDALAHGYAYVMGHSRT